MSTPDAVSPKNPRRGGLPDWAAGALSAMYLVLMMAGGILAFTYFRGAFSEGVTGFVFAQPAGSNEQTPGGPTFAPTLPLLSVPSYKPWDGVTRVTILAMGLDYRDVSSGNDGPPRTDTMLVLSMDPVTKTAGVISIPRDLWVEIPGFGFDRINKAYFLAETYRLPGGGPALAMQTVENLLGVPIDYYAVVDFNSFTDMVDEIGGIDVYIPFDNMRIDPVGKEDATLLFKGWNHLKGSWALAYARDRHASADSTSGGSDFDRAQRTQQVILAIRDKILDLNMLPTLIGKAPTLYGQLSAGVKTDLTLEQIISLALVAKDVSKENIRLGVIGPDHLRALETIENGGAKESVLVPDPIKIRELRNSIFASSGRLGYIEPPSGDLLALAIEENARILIRNGTGTAGVAAATKDYLVCLGFSTDNITIDNALYTAQTLVLDYTGMPHTMHELVELMKILPNNISITTNFDSPVDVEVILGADWVIPQQ